MESNEVRFGIIGCGVIAPWHAFGIEGSEGAGLVAVCDIIKEKAEALAEKNGSPKVYTDYKELLADPEVDAVCICIPSGLHAKIGIDAAKAGKHVLSEKPMDIKLENIDALIEACHKANVKLGGVFQRRTSQNWIKVRDAVRGGKLGKMVLGDAYIKYYRSQEYYDSGDWRGTWELDGGGALMNQGVHCIDLLNWIMGPIESIYAHAAPLVRNIEVEDTAVAAIKFANGAFGVLEGTTSVNPGLNHRLEFHGDKGSIRVEGEQIIEWSVPGEEMSESGDDTKDTAASNPTDIFKEGHRIIIQDFVRAIQEDRDPMVTGEEARKAVELILAIYKSSKTGMPVTLPLK
ncbi:MAG: Gfo/Idh/MocA family oxidoreductase [Armatimonadota bacterium]